ncbi:Putative AC9 transposase [Linum perenne]
MTEIAKDILAIPISSVSETAFSNGGRVLDDFRSSLIPSIVEALICSEDWLRNPDDNGNDAEDEEDQIEFEKEIAALNMNDSSPSQPGDASISSASTIIRPIVNQFVKQTTTTTTSKLPMPTIRDDENEDANENENEDEDEDHYDSEPCMDGAEDDGGSIHGGQCDLWI